jgi:hypothetical protein
MSTTRSAWLLCIILACACLAGCGGGDSSSAGGADADDGAGNTAQSAGKSGKSRGLPTASINRGMGDDEDFDDDDDPLEIVEPEQGSPEWLIREIAVLKVKPYPEDVGNDVDKLREARRERNGKIVELATEAIALTHRATDKERIFNVAAHYLMDARLQLALQGDKASVDSLYEDADSLFKRDPHSKAAADASFSLVRFAHANAENFADKEPRWLQEFARQARLFAKKFPGEGNRAVSELFAAAWSCELQGLRDEAIECYELLVEKFASSPHAEQSVAILRRLKLEGRSLELAGPTVDGGFVKLDEYRGQIVLIVFWATTAQPFLDVLPQILELSDKYGKYGFSVIGLNLDNEEPAIDAFLDEHAVTWPQIFYSDREKRRWKNPIVKYYGIRELPELWLVDHDGTVASTQITTENLESELRTLLQKLAQEARAKQQKTGS